jgi:hypothetical protein
VSVIDRVHARALYTSDYTQLTYLAISTAANHVIPLTKW